MITPGTSHEYDIVLADKYLLGNLAISMSIEESQDEIAMRGEVELIVTDDLPGITPGQGIRIIGFPFDTQAYKVSLLHPGVVWECNSSTRGQKHLTVNIYDKTIYLAKSEDEYLFNANQTASQRLQRLCSDWNIPVKSIPDTGVKLAKALRRSSTIYSMIQADLKETVKKGGGMYRPRMTPQGLELYKIGSNETVWVLEPENMEELIQKRTLEGTVTKVKVLGQSTDENTLSPVLAIETGETGKYGTLQKILSDSNIKTTAEGKTAAQQMLTGVQETFTVTAIDVNTIRAGDKVALSGLQLIVTSVRHELGTPGRMTLELASEDYVRRQYYLDESV
jgi:hypothetical protein